MKCIIIEDQPPAVRILKKYIADYGQLELVGTYGDAISALEFIRQQQVDLIFLDIHLPKLSGIDFLKSLINPPSIVLTTAYPDFALESYNLDVVDYLLKPFSFPRFMKAVMKVETIRAVNDTDKTPAKTIFIKSGFDHIKLELDDIYYIKSDRDYTEIFLSDKKVLSSKPLKEWLDDFPQEMLRVHKSYVINVNLIDKISSSKVTMKNNEEIPIGRVYKEEVARLLTPPT